MCGEVEPCGGDLTGTWVITNDCITSVGTRDEEAASCAGVTITVTSSSVSGTLTFNSDMTYSATSLTNRETIVLDLPESCTNGLPCSQATYNLEASSGVQSASCTGSGSCSCTVVRALMPGSETGTYSTSGSTVTFVPTGGGTSVISGNAGGASYCVQGSTLHAIDTSTMSMGAMGEAAIDADTIGIKQ